MNVREAYEESLQRDSHHRDAAQESIVADLHALQRRLQARAAGRRGWLDFFRAARPTRNGGEPGLYIWGGVVAALKLIYEDRNAYWDDYEMCEALMDIANNFQFWRFHHMKTVERIIGHKRGSGGSSGVSFLKKAIDIEFFPELIRVRSEIRE